MTCSITSKISRDDLRNGVEQVLSRHFRSRQRLKSIRRRRSAYSSSYALENLKVELESGRKLRLVLKDLSPCSMLSTARHVRPPFLYQPLREIEIYRRILSCGKFGTPVCYGAVAAPDQQRYWLFLERVDGPLLWQRGRLELWEQAAEWLARLHSEFDSSRGASNRTSARHLLNYDRQLLSTWLRRAEAFLSRKYGNRAPHLLRRFHRLAEHYDVVIEKLLQLPSTFIHGEFFPSNIILRETNNGCRICPVDWEVAAQGPGLMDLAALTSGNWTREHKTKLITAYRNALTRNNGWPPPMPEFIEAVDFCHLQLCIQLLGWSSDWSPPERHTQNWLAEAFRLAASLGI